MNAAVLAAIVFVAFALGYRFYSRFLSVKIFALAEDEPVPSRELEDGIDYVPTPVHVLWGHHYSSIAGAAPIVGPAIAVIWGWLPALLWVALGTIFMGAVHDFAALVISLRNRGRSIGEIAGGVISPRVRTLFLVIISFLIWIVLAVFAFIIGTLFVSTPSAIFPIWIQMAVAMVLGWIVYRRKMALLAPSLVAYALLVAAIFYGDEVAAAVPALTRISVLGWVWILLLYSFVASVLPVWLLLQPRDFLNSHQLITGLLLLTGGLLVLQPTIQAPMVVPAPDGAPPMIPFLFITIACGAISGFHGLVASGTTSKQIGCMTDARPIGYGGMIGEGTLGLLAVLAATAGFATTAEWHGHYASWGEASGLSAKLGAFVNGGATFVASLGIPVGTAKTFMAVMVIAFAATSLDTGARIQRLVIAELAEAYGVRALTNRYVAGAVGIGAALLLALNQGGGQGGLILWPLFGTTNQLVAGVTLLVVSVWLQRQGRPVAYTLVPMIAVGAATVWAMTGNVLGYFQEGLWLLAGFGTVILALDVWVVFEGARVLLGAQSPPPLPELTGGGS
ncbi:MAG: carbon starvation protein A [Proteobacteria bacterium]|nr:carbon starvation protein A [Pseudomonadota bacterium]